MDNLTNEANDAFMEVAMKKMESLDKKLAMLEERFTNGSDHTKDIHQLIANIEKLKKVFDSGQFITKVQDCSARITVAIGLLQKPVQNTVTHHHHVPKLMWITSGLFIALSLVCSGWYMTTEKLTGFIANDTKYRMLKLDTANKRLQANIYQADSLYQVNPGIREMVIKREEQNKRNLEMLQKAREMEKEANELKIKVHKSK